MSEMNKKGMQPPRCQKVVNGIFQCRMASGHLEACEHDPWDLEFYGQEAQAMSDKTELRAAIDAAVHELASMLPKNKTLSDAGHLIVGDIIERHIAPVLQSARAAAIEECVKSVGSFPLSVDEENRGRLVNRLRALREQL